MMAADTKGPAHTSKRRLTVQCVLTQGYSWRSNNRPGEGTKSHSRDSSNQAEGWDLLIQSGIMAELFVNLSTRPWMLPHPHDSTKPARSQPQDQARVETKGQTVDHDETV